MTPNKEIRECTCTSKERRYCLNFECVAGGVDVCPCHKSSHQEEEKCCPKCKAGKPCDEHLNGQTYFPCTQEEKNRLTDITHEEVAELRNKGFEITELTPQDNVEGLRKEISQLLVKNNMPTRQVFINEIMSLLSLERAKVVGEIEGYKKKVEALRGGGTRFLRDKEATLGTLNDILSLLTNLK